jgi:hypothetical protein
MKIEQAYNILHNCLQQAIGQGLIKSIADAVAINEALFVVEDHARMFPDYEPPATGIAKPLPPQEVKRPKT